MKNAKIPMLGSSVPKLSAYTVPPPKKEVDSIYNSPEYREWRQRVIDRANGRCEDPRCQDPSKSGRRYADHIKELRDGGAPFDLNNGMCRCASCHTFKTHEERAKRLAS